MRSRLIQTVAPMATIAATMAPSPRAKSLNDFELVPRIPACRYRADRGAQAVNAGSENARIRYRTLGKFRMMATTRGGSQ